MVVRDKSCVHQSRTNRRGSITSGYVMPALLKMIKMRQISGGSCMILALLTITKSTPQTSTINPSISASDSLLLARRFSVNINNALATRRDHIGVPRHLCV
jgi:hypothetical protein